MSFPPPATRGPISSDIRDRAAEPAQDIPEPPGPHACRRGLALTAQGRERVQAEPFDAALLSVQGLIEGDGDE